MLADYPVPSPDFLIEYDSDLGHSVLGSAIFFFHIKSEKYSI